MLTIRATCWANLGPFVPALSPLLIALLFKEDWVTIVTRLFWMAFLPGLAPTQELLELPRGFLQAAELTALLKRPKEHGHVL